MRIRNAADVQVIAVEEGASGVRIRWLLDEDQGAPNFSMRRFEIDPGGHTPLHAHAWEHEVYIISGRGSVMAGQQPRPLGPGDAVLVEANEEHQFRASEGEQLCLLCLVPNGPATER